MSVLTDHKRKQKNLKNIVKACQHLLRNSKNAKITREYLNSRLDIDDQTTWQFGYFPNDSNLKELTDIVSKNDLEEFNLYYPKFLAGGSSPHGHFSDHNLILPFKDEYEDVIALLGRCLLPEEERVENLLQKYKYSNGCSKELYVYGLNKAKASIIEKDFVIGVEGQFDCISLHSRGIDNAIAFGWANMSKYQLFKLHRYTNNIVLMFDNDEAGQKAKTRVKKRFKEVANIKVVNPPKNFKDIEEFFRGCKDPEFIQIIINKIQSFGS